MRAAGCTRTRCASSTRRIRRCRTCSPARRVSSTASARPRAHFDGLCRHLADAGVAYTIDARLVRGLDYYNRSVFEWVAQGLGAQGTIAGGGRYDGLFAQLGGKPTPACGFGSGIERLMLLMREAGPTADAAPLAYVVHAGEAAAPIAARLAEALRDARHAAVLHAGGGSFVADEARGRAARASR